MSAPRAGTALPDGGGPAHDLGCLPGGEPVAARPLPAPGPRREGAGRPAVAALRLVLAGPTWPGWLDLVLVLLAGALGALAGGVAGLFRGPAGRPGGMLAWTLLFPLVLFGGLIAPMVDLSWSTIGVPALVLFAPLLLTGILGMQDLLSRRQGAKGEAYRQVFDLLWMKHLRKNCSEGLGVGARAGVLLA